MIKARWENLLGFDSFRDLDRSVIGKTAYEETVLDDVIEDGKDSVKFWMDYYRKNRWENQPYYVEVFIEKRALQGVFEGPCNTKDVALSPCKGYPSLTFMYDAAQRMQQAVGNGKEAIILYFGDYDPSGEDIPRSIQETMNKMYADVRVERVLLLEDQVLDWNLPPAPTKVTDSRSRAWNGLGQVELDAVEPNKLKTIVTDSINKYFDYDLHQDLMDEEEEEKEEYTKALKDFVKGL